MRCAQPPPHEGVHLLAPNDPWLANGDRALVLPDRGRQKLVWRSLHSPGVVLVDGDVAGTWKGRLTGDVLEIAVSPFAALPERTLADLEAEAERVAKVRGARELSRVIEARVRQRGRTARVARRVEEHQRSRGRAAALAVVGPK